MKPPEHAIQEAMVTISRFLRETAALDRSIPPGAFRELSARIELARTAREAHHRQFAPGGAYSSLCEEYRRQLERLRERLGELEISLCGERDRIAREHDSVIRTREWRELLGKTQ